MSITKLDVNIFLKLIKAHTQNDEIAFKDICLDLCNKLDRKGDGELSSYILAQLGLVPTFSPGGGELPSPEERELNERLTYLIDAVISGNGANVTKGKNNVIGIFDSYATKKAERLTHHDCL